MRPTPAILVTLALVASASAQSNSKKDTAALVAALQARSQLQHAPVQAPPPSWPAWTPPPSQDFHPYSFNNLGIGSTGRGNFISPHRSVTEIPGYVFNPVTGAPATPPTTGPITIQPYPYPITTRPYSPYSRPCFNDYYPSGFYLNGRYRGDHWNINFNLGTGLMPSVYDFGGLLPIRVGNYEYSINPYTGSYVVTTASGRSEAYDTRAPGASAPSAPKASPARESTALERGQQALRDQDAAKAVKELRAHLRQEPADGSAMRLLAIALFENGNLDDGAAVLRNAYRTSPALADEPIAPEDLGLSAQRLREMLSEVVRHAHKVNTASAWLSVVSIMQGEGRVALARDMLDRAERAGLDLETIKAFDRALR
jgi:hypothetical protein